MATLHTQAPRLAWVLIAVLVGAWVSFFISFQAGIFALFFSLVAWWAWHYEEQALLLFVILAPLLPSFKVTQTIGTFTLIKDVIIVTLFARLVFIPLLFKRLPYRPHILLAPIFALVMWTVVAFARSNLLLLGVLRARDIILYVVWYLTLLYLPHSRRLWRERLFWFSAVVAIVLLLGVFQWFFASDSAVLRFDPARQIWIPRLSSLFGHPSVFGQFLLGSSTLAGAFILASTSWRVRILAGGALLLMIPPVILTYSRAVWIGWLAAAIVVAIVWLIKSRSVKSWFSSIAAGVGILIVATITLWFTPVRGLLQSIVDPSYASNQDRIEFLVRLVAPLSPTDAIVGRGLGDVLTQTFREVDLTTIEVAEGNARAVQLTKDQTLVDNQYLKTFIEMGVVGLVLYGWLYWRLARASLRLVRSPDEFSRLFGVWGVGFLTAFVVQAFFIDIWDIFPTNAIFWMVAAAVSVLSVSRFQRQSPSS